jgi:hypothetical protein
VRVARFSGTAALEGAGILIQNFPILRTDMPRALQLAQQIAECMVLEDEGKKIIQVVHDEDETV